MEALAPDGHRFLMARYDCCILPLQAALASDGTSTVHPSEMPAFYGFTPSLGQRQANMSNYRQCPETTHLHQFGLCCRPRHAVLAGRRPVAARSTGISQAVDDDEYKDLARTVPP